MSIHIIYKTYCIPTQKYYVGQHKQETQEFDGYLGSGLKIKRAIKKYGKENFFRETLEVCSEDVVDEREIFWIDKLSATDIGYNIDVGGSGGNNIVWTEEKRKEHSLIRKGKFLGEDNSNFGNKWTDKQKQLISRLNKGRKQSQETIDKRVTKNKGKKRSQKFVIENIERMKKLKENNPDIFSSGKDTVWMNNGKVTKRVRIKEVEQFEMKGFIKGRL